MPRAGQRIMHRKPAAAKPAGPAHRPLDALAHNRLTRYMDEHCEWMKVSGYSRDTIRARRIAIRRFIAWADERGIDDPREVTKPMLERYQRHLFYYRKEDGTPLTLGTQLGCLAPLKTWFRWLSREHHILANPAADIDLPRQPKRLPRSVPRVQEVEAILAEAEPTTPQGLRDRALLETLYATGLRRMEIVAVSIHDTDLGRGLLWVRHGKGSRQRVVPLGERAGDLTEAQPDLALAAKERCFLHCRRPRGKTRVYEKTSDSGRAAFVSCPQTRMASREIGLDYGPLVSGRTTYSYVNAASAGSGQTASAGSQVQGQV